MHRRASRSCQNILSTLPRHSDTSFYHSFRHQSTSVHFSHRKKADPKHTLSKEHYLDVKNITKKIIDRVAHQPHDWKHTPSLRGTEKRLAATLQNASSNRRGPSADKLAYLASEEPMDEDTGEFAPAVALGTFVETRRNLVASHGVVIGEATYDRRRRLVMLTSDGEIWRPVREDVLFTIPALAPTDLCIRCGTDDVALNDTQIHARIEVLKRLREVEKDIDNAYNAVCQKNAKVYDTVKSVDPDKWSETTIAEVARIVKSEPDIIAVFAIHKYLMSHPSQFVAHHAYTVNQRFNVRPQSHIKELETIQGWLRRRDGPIQAFAEKARGVILVSQTAFEQSRDEAPSQAPADHTWTTDDKTILSFLQHSLRRTRSSQDDPYILGQASILKAIDVNRPPIQDDQVHKLLVDLGVLAPWQDLFVLEPEIDLDLEPEATSSRIKADDARVLKALYSPSKSVPLGPEDFHPTDPLESVRHDFGDMPVYVIDEANSEELDDGVSIERIPSEPNNFWAHVHVADPASVIPPTNVFAREAAIKFQTAYFMFRSWPLFPRRLMHDPKHGLSLGSKEGSPTRVLTFSSKINPQGEVLDFNVRAGIIRKIHAVTYDEVDAALGFSNRSYWYPFGDEPSKLSSPSSFTPSQIKDLRDLSMISKRIVDKRQRDPVYNISYPTVELSKIGPRPPDFNGPTFEPSTFRGFPKFIYSAIDVSELETGAHGLVAEMMKLGSRVASRFCLEKGIPVLRRVADPSQIISDPNFQKILDMRDERGFVRHDKVLPLMQIAPSADYALEPKAHFNLGIPAGEGYTRVTSPLRRYMDLVHHWQLHHALLGSSAPRKSPPFDSTQLADLLLSMKAMEQYWKVLSKNDSRFWQCTQLKRWVEDTARGVERHNDPLMSLEATLLDAPSVNFSTRRSHAEVHVRLLGINGLLENLELSEVKKGDTIPVKLLNCRLGLRPQVTFVRK
ncbi:Exoribonuclease II, mitochondrial [Hypsizygus marmoreus]|uniref:Exoribonuclease II, mitochondrial n=1 Tax=Hypsizygus marmoreus TaxID=39966 RepID=A0A369K5G4_HYPMA|nr:Exoribonuclease II, mitochondrial [Hypsizygus marmoreus]